MSELLRELPPTTRRAEEIAAIDRWWRAANYLSAGQIYLRAKPLLRRPLQPADIKPRLLGHWGTAPGLTFIQAHLNRYHRARRSRHIIRLWSGAWRTRHIGVRLAGWRLSAHLSRRVARSGRYGAPVPSLLGSGRRT